MPKRRVAAQYPALCIFTTPGRLVRPVRNLTHDAIELIGTLEQTYFYIATSQKQILADPVSYTKVLVIIYIFILVCCIVPEVVICRLLDLALYSALLQTVFKLHLLKPVSLVCRTLFWVLIDTLLRS